MALSVILTLLQILGSDTAILVGIREWFEFQDGKRGAQKGFIYTILLTNSQCAPLNVKIAEDTAAISQDILDSKNAAIAFQKVKFLGFAAKPYVDRNGQIQYSATAEKIILVDNNGTGATK